MFHRQFIIAGLLWLIVTLTTQAADYEVTRLWTDKNGNQNTATFVDTRNGETQLRDDTGNVLKLKLADFSEPDQKYLRELANYKKKVDAKQEATLPVDPAENSLTIQPIRAAATTAAEPVPQKPLGDYAIRVWTDNTGRKMQAKWLTASGDKIVVDMKGRVFNIPVGNMSPDDQKYVAVMLKALHRDDLLAELKAGVTKPADQVATTAPTQNVFPPQVAANPIPAVTPPTGMPPSASSGTSEREKQLQEELRKRLEADREASIKANAAREAEIAKAREATEARRQAQLAEARAQAEAERAKQPQFVTESYCSNCNGKLKNSAAVGQTCPHCGVTFSYIKTEDSQSESSTSDDLSSDLSTSTSNSSSSYSTSESSLSSVSNRSWSKLITGVIALGGFVLVLIKKTTGNLTVQQ